MTLWGQITESRPKLPPAEPVALKVQDESSEGGMGSSPPSLTEGIRALYQKCHFYDVFLVGGGSRFPAHQAVLAALSPKLRDRLCDMRDKAAQTEQASIEAGEQQAEASGKNPELTLSEISSPEALRALLDFVYGLDEYHVSSEAANSDVLRLARQFDLNFLEQCAMRWLTKGLTVANVITRLVTCEEFALSDLAEQIKEQLTSDPQLLIEVTRQIEAARHPEILQSLLMRVAMRSASAAAPAPAPAPAPADLTRPTNDSSAESTSWWFVGIVVLIGLCLLAAYCFIYGSGAGAKKRATRGIECLVSDESEEETSEGLETGGPSLDCALAAQRPQAMPTCLTGKSAAKGQGMAVAYAPTAMEAPKSHSFVVAGNAPLFQSPSQKDPHRQTTGSTEMVTSGASNGLSSSLPSFVALSGGHHPPPGHAIALALEPFTAGALHMQQHQQQRFDSKTGPPVPSEPVCADTTQDCIDAVDRSVVAPISREEWRQYAFGAFERPADGVMSYDEWSKGAGQ